MGSLQGHTQASAIPAMLAQIWVEAYALNSDREVCQGMCTLSANTHCAALELKHEATLDSWSEALA